MDESTAALVRQMREALAACESPVDIGLQRRKAIAAADQWLAQQRGPLTDEEITSEAFTGHGYAQGTTGSAMFRRGVRYAERAHRIGQPLEPKAP